MTQQRLKITGNGFELINTAFLFRFQRANRIIQAVLNVVLYQHPLCLLNGFFHSMELLRQFQAGSPCLNHSYHATQMTLSPLQAFNNLRMRVVRLCQRITIIIHTATTILTKSQTVTCITTRAITATNPRIA